MLPALSNPHALRPRSRETTGSASGGPARPAALMGARAVARLAPEATRMSEPKASRAAARGGPPEAPSSFPGRVGGVRAVCLDRRGAHPPRRAVDDAHRPEVEAGDLPVARRVE